MKQNDTRLHKLSSVTATCTVCCRSCVGIGAGAGTGELPVEARPVCASKSNPKKCISSSETITTSKKEWRCSIDLAVRYSRTQYTCDLYAYTCLPALTAPGVLALDACQVLPTRSSVFCSEVPLGVVPVSDTLMSVLSLPFAGPFVAAKVPS
eukprot:20943-Heterococcus_DN1.PRE.1